MKVFKKSVFIIASCIASFASAQQLPQFTQYMYNTISINPAYAGSRETLSAVLLHRNQWSGLEGNPQTSTFSIHTPLKNEKIGLGISYINDNLGDENTNYIYGDFSYSLPLSREIKMSFGLKAGFTHYKLDSPDPNDPQYNGDETLAQWSPNLGVGFYLGSDRWFAGISTPRILSARLNNEQFEALERISYYAIGGMVFDISPDTKFKPTVLAKFTSGAPASYDMTANFLFYEKLWIGASYRFNHATSLGAIVDFQVSDSVRIGYAYDLPTGDIRPYTSGTHEFLLIYEIPRKKKGIYKSPRYF